METAVMRILLAEDDPQLGDSLRAALALESYAVDWLRYGDQVFEASMGTPYDALILDIGLPRMSGLDILRAMRRDDVRTPVILLTARDSIEDRVRGLDLGADDYLSKPFDIDELFARLRSLLRRTTPPDDASLVIGDIEISLQGHEVRCQGKEVILTAKEKALLELLARQQGRFVSRARIEEGLYQWGDVVGSNTIEVYISRLRKHLGSARIETLRGVGYRLVE